MVNKRTLDELLSNTGDLCLRRRARLMIEEIDPQPSDKILDVGCGDGFYEFLLTRITNFKNKIIGIDLQVSSIAAAKKLAAHKSVQYVAGDITKYPFTAASFDKIICSEVVEHFDDDLVGLKSMHRLLKKGGSLFITVPHLNYPFFWDPINWVLQHFFGTHIKSGFWAGIWNMHDRLYTVDTITRVVKKAGFTIEKIACLTHYSLPFNHTFVYVGFRLRTLPQLSAGIKNSMSKFQPQSAKKSWFSYVMSFIIWLDTRNDRDFGPNDSTVCIYVKATKR